MVWTQEKEVLLCREVVNVEPYKFKEKTKERGQCWTRICNDLLLLPDFQSLTARAVREKTAVLLDLFYVKDRADLAATGINPEVSELDVLLEEILLQIEEFSKTFYAIKSSLRKHSRCASKSNSRASLHDAAMFVYMKNFASSSKLFFCRRRCL